MPGSGAHRKPRFAARWGLRVALLGLLLLGHRVALGADPPVSKEYQVKAAFLYNFTKFIEWPPQSFSRTTDPIVIGVLGHAALGTELQRIVQGRRVNGRGIVVKQMEAVDDARSIHLLFVSASEDARLAGLASAIARSPVLSVGESPSFATSGGAIIFVLDDDKVRFEINIASIERAGLHVSAQLQKLATAVRRAP